MTGGRPVHLVELRLNEADWRALNHLAGIRMEARPAVIRDLIRTAWQAEAEACTLSNP